MPSSDKLLSMTDARLHSPSVERNRDPILAVLRPLLDGASSVLEIASGSGGHVVHFAAALPAITFQPTDPDDASRASIDAWAAASALANVRPAMALDVTARPWPMENADAVICINMIHISPWAATLGLMHGAAQVLRPGGLLFLYGPYRRDGAHTADSNEAFDRSLRGRNAAWGIRDLEDVAQAAAAEGFGAPTIVAMPANNLSVTFRR
jgi:SAM-dependent methyltransferase